MGVEHWTVPAVAPAGLSIGEMKHFIREHFQAFVNERDLTQADRSFSADFLDHDEPTGVEVGVEAAKAMMQKAHARWPDLHVGVKDIIAEGDRVTVRNVWTGTEITSQKQTEFHGFVLWRFANGRIVERWAATTARRRLHLDLPAMSNTWKSISADSLIVRTPGPGTLPLLTCLTALGSVSVSIYLPSLPELSRALHAAPSLIKLSLTAFLFVFALSQLAYGPLSDRFGRKPPILMGLLIYIVGSLGCAFAWTAPLLISARIVQAIGAAAGPALGRAVLRDFYSGVKLTSSLSIIAAAVALSPMLGPVLGGYLQVAFGWRSSFFFLTLCGILLLAGVSFLLPESSPHIDEHGLSLSVIGDHYRSLLTDREYVAALLCGGLLTAGNFSWTAGAPFLFASTYHFAADRYGNIALIIGAGYVLGTFASGFLSRRLFAPTVVYSGMLLAFAASIALSFLSQRGSGYFPIVATMFVFTVGMGVVIPLSAACALSRRPEIAGAAAGLLGALQILTGALGTVAISSVSSVSVTPVATILVATVVGASIAAYFSLLSFRRQVVSTEERLA